MEKRCETRKPYTGHIFYCRDNGIYEGRLKNYSRYGLYIESKDRPEVGEIISVALPFRDKAHPKVKGRIRWSSWQGFGVELVRNHPGAHLKLIR
jgi:hypothetical protein